MKAEATTESTSYVLVKMTAEEARELATHSVNGAALLRATLTYDSTNADYRNVAHLANQLEILASALGVALAQMPKEGE